MSDLVGNPEDRFSHNEAHLIAMQRYVSYCCISNLSQLGVKKVLKKNCPKPSGGQIVKSHKRNVFIMLSCWISPNNGNRLSRPNGTETQILCFFPFLGLTVLLLEHDNGKLCCKIHF